MRTACCVHGSRPHSSVLRLMDHRRADRLDVVLCDLRGRSDSKPRAARMVAAARPFRDAGNEVRRVGWVKRSVPTMGEVGTRSLSSGRPEAGPVGFAHPTLLSM